MKKSFLILLSVFIALSIFPSCSTTNPPSVALRGATAAGGEIVYTRLPAVEGTNYQFLSHQEIDYLVSKKMNFMRLIFSWEEMQPTLNGPLSTSAYATQLKDRVDYATSKGMYVLLEPHGGSGPNFARYKGYVVGSTEVPNSAFADFWSKMAVLYKANSKVMFGLSAKPNNMSTVQWFSAAQAAITGIRAAGFNNMIFVPGNGYTGASNWTSDWYDTSTTKVSNAKAFLSLKDPVANLVASVHLYLDINANGSTTDLVSTTIGKERLTAVVAWAKENKVKVHVTEFAAAASNPLAKDAVSNLINYMNANNDVILGWSWWATGAQTWWGSHKFTLVPVNGVDSPQMALLTPFLAIPPSPLTVPTAPTSTPKVLSPTTPSAPIAFTKEKVFTTNSGNTNWAYVPASYDTTHQTPNSLFVWLHGCGGKAEYDVYMVSPGGNQSWISLAVGGREGYCWSWYGGVDEPKVLAAIADFKTHFNIDPKRVVLGGYSSGGDIGYQVLFRNANLFAGGIFQNTAPSTDAMTLANNASWKLNIAHMAHLSDTTYPVASVRSKMNTLKSKGFMVTLLEKPGTHWDKDTGTSGTAYDLKNSLLPFLNAGWVQGQNQNPADAGAPDAGIDAGAVDAGVPATPTFKARVEVYNKWDVGYCANLVITNTSKVSAAWHQVGVNFGDGTIRDWWSMKPNSTTVKWGAGGTLYFLPLTGDGVANQWVSAGQSINAGFCADDKTVLSPAYVTGID